MGNKTKINLFLIALGVITIILSLYLNDDGFFRYILTYLGVLSITLTLPDWKIFKIIKIIISIPAGIFFYIGPLLKVFFVFTYAYLLPFGLFSFFYKYVPIYILNFNLSYASKVYLVLTSTTIFVTLFSEKIMIWTNKIINENNPDELVSLYHSLGTHLINKHRTRYIIFFSFFIYLIIYSLTSLNQNDLFNIENTNVAIMQTFGTYIAFDRLISNRNLFEFKPKIFLQKLSKIWIFDYNDNKIGSKKNND